MSLLPLELTTIYRRLLLPTLIAAVALAVVASAAGADSFNAKVTPLPKNVRATMTGVTWQPDCPVGFKDLRLITSVYHDPKGATKTGKLVVHRDAAAALVRVLKRIWRADFPIARMQLIDAYGGDDWKSIEANNTSAFNCRKATGSKNWSNHAYGRAIDINPIQNPYVSGGKVFHKASWRYIDRSQRKSPLEILAGDAVTRAFAAEGWSWGGSWSGTKDYQHFSVDGR